MEISVVKYVLLIFLCVLTINGLPRQPKQTRKRLKQSKHERQDGKIFQIRKQHKQDGHLLQGSRQHSQDGKLFRTTLQLNQDRRLSRTKENPRQDGSTRLKNREETKRAKKMLRAGVQSQNDEHNFKTSGRSKQGRNNLTDVKQIKQNRKQVRKENRKLDRSNERTNQETQKAQKSRLQRTFKKLKNFYNRGITLDEVRRRNTFIDSVARDLEKQSAIQLISPGNY